MSTLFILLLALILDAVFGEPRWLWDRVTHPAVAIGRVISWLEARLNTGSRAGGMLALAALVTGAILLGLVLRALPFGGLIEMILAAILIAQRSLADHVRDVATGLRESLAEGRRQVARIVGRDVEALDASGIARGAIESGAENLSDGVIAPAFWFAILGLPGILAYKAINTADSMIGYRTPRYEAFGWASAKLDDLVNWIPARLTAVLILIAIWRPDLWGLVKRDSALHRSPNAGWPEAAMAGALDIALSGPRSYDGVMGDEPYVNPDGRKVIGPAEIDAAVSVLWKAWGVGVVLVLMLALIT